MYLQRGIMLDPNNFVGQANAVIPLYSKVLDVESELARYRRATLDQAFQSATLSYLRLIARAAGTPW